jgi:hypothetical protein
MSETTLAFFRPQFGAERMLGALLQVKAMAWTDRVQSEREIREYLETGDVGAARALIQHARARRNAARIELADPV